MMALVAVIGPVAAGDILEQTNHFSTGFVGPFPLTIPSIDPAGIGWHAPSGHLFVADSEINEVTVVFDEIQANIFEISPDGSTLYGSYDLTVFGDSEPTGITYNEFDGFFYVSNDDNKTVTRYAFSPGTGFTLDDQVSTLPTLPDPEGITCDPATGLIYVVDGGDEVDPGGPIAVYSYDTGTGAFVLEEVLDIDALNPGAAPGDPEGIAFDPVTGNLLLVSGATDRLYEFDTAGLLLSSCSLSSFSPFTFAVQGLTLAPTSTTADDPTRLGLFFADARVDNNQNPNERDGAIYEATFELNTAPDLAAVADQVINESSLLTVPLDASDYNLDALTWSMAGAPAGATLSGSGVFQWTPGEAQGPGSYLVSVRVTDDGDPPLATERSFLVSVGEVNLMPEIQVQTTQMLTAGTLLTFDANYFDPDTRPALLGDLVAYWPFDAGYRSTTGTQDGTPAGGADLTAVAVLGEAALALDADASVDFGGVVLPGDFAVAAWLYPENIGPGAGSDAVILGDAGGANLVRLQDGEVFLAFGGVTTTLAASPAFVNDAWQHFALLRSGGTVTVYRNGDAVASGPLADAFAPELIGHDASGPAHFVGSMDDVAIWDEAIAAADVVTLYDSGAGRAVSDAGTVPANNQAFSLHGNVPIGAAIDVDSGVFTWLTPSNPDTYVFEVRVTDDGIPSKRQGKDVTVTTTAAPCDGDTDGDGFVDVNDLNNVILDWGTDGTANGGDLTGQTPGSGPDGFVDVNDLNLIIIEWGVCR